MDSNSTMDMLIGASIGLQIFQLLVYILYSYGIFKINSHFAEPYPWLAFVPFLNIYSFVKASGRDGIWVLWLFLGFIAFGIPGLIIAILITNDISKRCGYGALMTLGLIFLPFIFYPYIGSKLEG